jgi:hypothetical protein
MLPRLWVCASVIAVAFISVGSASGQVKGTNNALDNDAAIWAHRITGEVVSMKDGQLQVKTRDKRIVRVDASEAIRNKRVNVYLQGSRVTIYGAYDANGTLHAQSIQRAKKLPSAWAQDR